MNVRLKAQSLTVALADVVILYASLLAALVIRERGLVQAEILWLHIGTFTGIFVGWILVFYIAGLYDTHRLRNTFNFFSTLLIAIGICAAGTISFFYLLPNPEVSPKTTLAGFLVILTAAEIIWRRWFNRYVNAHAEKVRTMLIGDTPAIAKIKSAIEENPQFGYTIIDSRKQMPGSGDLEALVREKNIQLIAIPYATEYDSGIDEVVFSLLTHGVEIQNEVYLYEELLKKVPNSVIGDQWFFEHHVSSQTLYDQFKRVIECVGAVILQILLAPVEIVIAILILASSRGSVIYKQKRIGKNKREFWLYKFRSMRTDAEKNGAQWSSTLQDPRITGVGKVLRYSHLDELPQLLNILKGDISFVGPRPERPEFVQTLEKEIPHYHMRHLIAPGVTGWAQINWKKDASVDDTREKLEYDLYYLKHRSFIFDLAIILKTAKSLFINQ